MQQNERMKLENVVLLIFSSAFFFASWLVANISIGGSVTWVSALFIVIIAIPSYYYLVRWIGLKKGIAIIAIFSVFPIIIEAIGISTGFPYGPFHYEDWMGYKLLGLVPWSVAFAFAPLILGSITIASRRTNRAIIAIPLSALILVAVDLVLDPAAVVLSIWVWEQPGPYYGIPITNYTGWFMTAIIASVLMHLTICTDIRKSVPFPKTVSSSLLISIAFWTGFSVWTGLVIPIGIGVILMMIIVYDFLFHEDLHR